MVTLDTNNRQLPKHSIWQTKFAALLLGLILGCVLITPHIALADEPSSGGGSDSAPAHTLTTPSATADKPAPLSPGWNERDGAWYYADDQGYLVTGWILYKDRWYYCDAQGRMVTGIIDDASGKRYVADETGAMLANAWVKPGQHWVYATSSGALVMNRWYQVDGQWYHFNAQGYMQTGVYQNDEGIAYYLGDNGAMCTGWTYTPQGWMFADENGALANGFVWWKGKWYCLDKNTYLMKKWLFTHPDYTNEAFYCDGNGVMQYGWVHTALGWIYADEKGYLVTGWQHIDGTWYLFGDDYMMRTGVIRDAAQKWYCLGSNGAMQTGWVKTNQGWVYAQPSGELFSGLHRIDGASYYFKTSDAPLMQTGVITIDGKRFGAASSGALVANGLVSSGSDLYGTDEHCHITTGWFKDSSGARYYLDPADQGRAVRGIHTIDGKQFFFDKTSCKLMTDTIVTDGDHRWFVNAAGESSFEIRKLSNGKYQAVDRSNKPYPAGFIAASNNRMYVDTDGTLHVGWLTAGGSQYYCDAMGLVTTGWKEIGGTWYYFNAAGKMQTGWLQEENTWFYLDKSGRMQTGWVQDEGTWYFMSPGGRMQTGWLKDEGSWFFLSPGGRMQTGWVKDNGSWYYMSPGGRMQTGWLQLDSVWYYLASSGHMVTGWTTIDGTPYYFASNGAWVSDTSDMGARAQSYSSPTNYLIMVDVDNKYVGVYTGHAGAWNLVKRFRCTVGDYYHQTPRGTFSIQSRGYSFSTSWCTCYYYLQYYGDYLFHSPPELFSGGTLSAMGTEGSHGCVRIEKFNAKWMYETIPTGTTVITY